MSASELPERPTGLLVNKICANCAFAKLRFEDVHKIECHGLPPTLMMVGAKPGPLGGMNIQIEQFRPQLDKTSMACSLFRARLDS